MRAPSARPCVDALAELGHVDQTFIASVAFQLMPSTFAGDSDTGVNDVRGQRAARVSDVRRMSCQRSIRAAPLPEVRALLRLR